MFRPYMWAIFIQLVTGLPDQLYRNVWSVLGEFWGRGAVRDLIIAGAVPWYRVCSGGLPLVVFTALFFLKVGTTLMLGI